MTHRSLLLLLLLSPFLLASQNVLEGVIRDAETGTPIPFANIGIVAGQRGTVSDLDGQYRLTIDRWTDSITVFTIGYESHRLLAEDVRQAAAIRLQPKAYDLPVAEVSAREFGPETIYGAYATERNHSVGFVGAQLGTGMAVSIPIEQETSLQSAHFMVNHAEEGDSLLFRVNLYDLTEDGVGESLLPENVIVAGAQERDSEIVVDLSAYQLVVDRSVVLALEWVRDDPNGGGNSGLTFRAARGPRQSRIFTKYTAVSDYQELDLPRRGRYTLCFYLKGKPVTDK